MYYIAEDPWPLGITLAALGLGLLAALRITGRGKFLIWGLVSLGLAVLVFVVEAAWVTDNERIEAVVHEIVSAANQGDVEGVLKHLAPDLVLEQGSESLNQARGEGLTSRLRSEAESLASQGNLARALIRRSLENTRFDFIHIGRLEAHASPTSRRGTAEFRAFASGNISAGSGSFNFATDANGTDWSFGLRETEPGVWQVTRITAVRLPFGSNLNIFDGRGRR